MTENIPDLLRFFKALADETRLEMAGMLAREALSGEQIATRLGVKPATVSHHVSKLSDAGLISSRMEGHSKLFSLRLDVVHATAGQISSIEKGLQDSDSKTSGKTVTKLVQNYLNADGSLKRIPAHRNKLIEVLKYILKDLVPVKRYTEKELNSFLLRFHSDVASLRRAMIDCKLMSREAGFYWLRES